MINTYSRQIKRGSLLPGGLRKRCYLIKKGGIKKVFCLWPIGSLLKRKILYSIKVDFQAKERGFPTRRWQKIGKNQLVKIRFEKKDYWLGIGDYLPGKPCKRWTKDYLLSAGNALAKLHKSFQKTNNSTLLHLDFARGNILFNKEKKITGILDFEEADWGEPEKDLACSLSFMVVDTPKTKPQVIFKYFLKGYNEGEGNFDYDKIKKYFWEFMGVRMKEGSKQAFLLLAKKKLDNYRQRVKSKILKKEELKEFAKKNKGKKIVFTVGAFELIHWGYLEYLEKAKASGDLLIVGVASDESRRKLKGEPYPLISERTRAETLAHFPFVDRVVIVNEEDISQEIKNLQPKIFYTAAKDWQDGVRKKTEEKLLRTWGGKVVKSRYFSPNVSSTKMVEKVALMKIKRMLGQKTKRQPILFFKKPKKILKEVKFSDLGKLGEKLHRQGKTTAFASGTADLFHLGHARFYQKAKSLADVLLMGIPSNESVRALKGPGRPFIDEKARALVMAYLDWVDYVVIFDERTIFGCLQKLKPDVFFTVKEDWNTGFLSSPEAQFMRSIGGKIVRSEKQSPYLSASKMIDKAAGELIQKKFSELIKIARETPIFDVDGFDPHSPATQLAAREKGFYDQVLSAVAKRGKCVFCDLKEKYLVEEKDGVILTVALFPYNDGHLLIIPRRHIELMAELDKKEQEAVFYLTQRGIGILKEKLGVDNTWFLLREGKGINVGKTVVHLHFHLIPYAPEVIRMGDKQLTITPLELVQKLRKAK